MSSFQRICAPSKRDASVRPAAHTAGPISAISGMRLCVLHNLYFYNTMMTEIREAIENHCYAEYKEKKLEGVTGNYKDKV